MAFPDTALDVRVQLLIFGEWQDMGPVTESIEDYITDEVVDVIFGRTTWDRRRLPDQTIQIDVGRPDEASDVGPSRATLQLWNFDGWLTPGNRLSPWWSENPGGWDLNTPIQILVNDLVLFRGEVSQITPAWPYGDDSYGDVPAFALVSITASGVLRRLSQRTKPLRSPLTRLAQYNASIPGRVAGYWPFEDGENATAVASGIESRPRAGRIRGFQMASDSSLVGSDPLPKLSSGSDGDWSVPIDGAMLDGHWCIDWFGSFGSKPTETSLGRILEVRTEGADVTKWRVDLFFDGTADRLWIQGFDSTGALRVDATTHDPELYIGLDFYGKLCQIQFSVDGDNWVFAMSPVGDPAAPFYGMSGDNAGTAGYPVWAGGGFENVAYDVMVGQVMARRTDTAMPNGWARPADMGYPGDPAGVRMTRLCNEEHEAIAFVGDVAKTTPMGPQHSGTLLDLLRECAASDMGVFCERRTATGLRYRTRRSRYNQPVVWTIDARTGGLVNPFEPTRDDQQVTNDLTLERIGGSKYQAVDQASIDRVGRYDASVQVSLDTDLKGTLRHQAHWRLHLGTDQGMRYPQVTVDLATITDPSEALDFIVRSLGVGDVIRVENVASQLDGQLDPIDLVVEGWSLTFSPYSMVITMNCSPAKPIARWGISRYRTRNSRLAIAVGADATTLPVASSGVGWTTSDASFPFDVLVGGAEQVTVTDITGSAPSQTFTVTRNVNGLGRSHPVGASVIPYDRGVLGL